MSFGFISASQDGSGRGVSVTSAATFAARTAHNSSLAGVGPQRQHNLMYSSNETYIHAKKVRIGGPGTILPFWLESLFSWLFAIACLGVALYHWIQQVFGLAVIVQFISLKPRPIVPLMIHSRYEMTNASGLERYEQLIQYLSLQIKKPQKKSIEAWTDEDWIHAIRNDHVVRRLVSLIQLHQSDIPKVLDSIMDRFERIWPALLKLPSLPPPSPSNAIEISIVTSAYKEDGRDLVERFQEVLDLAVHPESIELILVNAGHCQQWNLVATSALFNSSSPANNKMFAKISTYDGTGGGRGPSLNQGAALAQGRILTFLHADTRLSLGWDTAIRNAFLSPTSSDGRTPTTTACAFSFAIDRTPKGLQGGPFPPGIEAIEVTANWRTRLFHLPYGDQCLSIPKVYFDYLGGYPHQCLMEDYEFVRLLRHRVANNSKVSCQSSHCHQERLTILPLKAHCSPRRWQTFGVLYVTYTNSRCVSLYARGELTPDDLFQVYYGVPANPAGVVERKSPWEVELQELLLTYSATNRP